MLLYNLLLFWGYHYVVCGQFFKRYPAIQNIRETLDDEFFFSGQEKNQGMSPPLNLTTFESQWPPKQVVIPRIYRSNKRIRKVWEDKIKSSICGFS